MSSPASRSDYKGDGSNKDCSTAAPQAHFRCLVRTKRERRSLRLLRPQELPFDASSGGSLPNFRSTPFNHSGVSCFPLFVAPGINCSAREGLQLSAPLCNEHTGLQSRLICHVCVHWKTFHIFSVGTKKSNYALLSDPKLKYQS